MIYSLDKQTVCFIGAGALVKEGMAVPDGSLVVGVPGKSKASWARTGKCL